MAGKFGDVRPRYDAGSTGERPAEGVFIAGQDGAPIDLSQQPTLPQLTDRSAAVPAGEATELMPANPKRRYALVHNKSSKDLWISEFGPAEVDGVSSMPIPAGQQAKAIGTGAISAFSVNGANVYAVEG